MPVGDSWKKALMEEWVFISDEHTDEQPLLTTLSTRAPIPVTASLGQKGFLNNVILYPVRPRYRGFSTLL